MTFLTKSFKSAYFALFVFFMLIFSTLLLSYETHAQADFEWDAGGTDQTVINFLDFYIFTYPISDLINDKYEPYEANYRFYDYFDRPTFGRVDRYQIYTETNYWCMYDSGSPRSCNSTYTITTEVLKFLDADSISGNFGEGTEYDPRNEFDTKMTVDDIDMYLTITNTNVNSKPAVRHGEMTASQRADATVFCAPYWIEASINADLYAEKATTENMELAKTLLYENLPKAINASNICADPIPEDVGFVYDYDYTVTILEITPLDGDVEYDRWDEDTGDTEKFVSNVGDILEVGDILYTGFETTCLVEIKDSAGTTIITNIGELTNLELKSIYLDQDVFQTILNLRRGSITNTFNPIQGKRASFEIETPTSTNGVRGTTFKVKHDEDEDITSTYVYDGTVEVTDENGGNLVTLIGDEMTTVGEDGIPSEIATIPFEELLTGDEFDYNDSTIEVSSWWAVTSITALVLFVVLLIVTVILFILKKKTLGVMLLVIALLLLCCGAGTGTISLVNLFYMTDDPDVTTDSNTTGNSDILSGPEEFDTYNDNTDEYEDTIEDVIEETEEYAAEGKIFNEDYDYTVTVGMEYAMKMSLSQADATWATSEYCYCCKTSDTSYEGDIYCGANEVPIFTISVATEEQWLESQESPFADLDTLIAIEDDMYYVFSHPNGILPDDVPQTQDFYDSVTESIEFSVN